MGAQSADKPRRVLVTRFSALGDVAMTIPVLYSVAMSNPSTEFIFVTRKSMTGMFVNPPENVIVVGIDFNTSDYKGVTGLRRLYRELKDKYDFDAVADLHNVLRTMVIDFFARIDGCRVARINKGRGHKRRLTRRTNKVMLPLISQRARYREVFYRLGLVQDPKFKSLYGNGKGDPALFADITAPKGDGEKWIGIAPFAKHKGKIYPIELMDKVVSHFAGQPGVRIFLFGAGAEEAAVLDRWVSAYPGVVSLASKRYGFPAELSLSSYLDVMVSMDSANMHLASLVGTPVVSIWGATHPYCGFKGWRQSEADMVQLTMTCRPCSVFGDKPCHRGDYYCLSGIQPTTIIEKITSHIDG
ncbi:MAG: glycosyltransferase family 9 protein [Lachnoclostridium sp.]|nr:glycosyltransferase family 9 protein [Lachnoclostridium sp.]